MGAPRAFKRSQGASNRSRLALIFILFFHRHFLHTGLGFTGFAFCSAKSQDSSQLEEHVGRVAALQGLFPVLFVCTSYFLILSPLLFQFR
jgi:hypothetical protein